MRSFNKKQAASGWWAALIYWVMVSVVFMFCIGAHAVEKKVNTVVIGVDDNEANANIELVLAYLADKLLNDNVDAEQRSVAIARLLASIPDEVENALKPFGYYNSKVTVSVLNEGEKNKETVETKVSLGDPITVVDVIVNIEGTAVNEPAVFQWQENYPLQIGDRLVQPRYTQAKDQLMSVLTELGYLNAQFKQQQISLDLVANTAIIRLNIESGERFRYGDINVHWVNEQDRNAYTPAFITRYIAVMPGEEYHDQALQQTQSTLTNSGYFSAAQVRPQFDKTIGNVIPLEIELQAPKKYALSGSVGFGTDTGLRAGGAVENRRVNRVGHRLSLSASTSDIETNALLSYFIPQKRQTQNGVRVFASYIDENSDSRDSQTASLGIDVSRSLTKNGQFGFGVSYLDERFTELGGAFRSQLVVPRASVQYIVADNLQTPNRGISITSSLRGASDDLGSDLSFLQFNLSSRIVYQFGGNRLLSRLNLGQTLVDNDASLPSSFTYFTGGDNSVRGYAFESIGVEQEDGRLVGGENTLAASLEYERKVWRELALAAFIDVGDAYNDDLDLNVGIGIGARWRLPFGAVRLDIAQAQDLPGQPTRVHFTFGVDL